MIRDDRPALEVMEGAEASALILVIAGIVQDRTDASAALSASVASDVLEALLKSEPQFFALSRVCCISD